MTESRIGLIRLLGYAGLLPFILALAMQLLDRQLFSLQAIAVFTTYSAVILSFLAGALWGRGLFMSGEGGARLLLVCSNFVALLAWGSILLNVEGPALLLLSAGFVVVFTIEWSRREGLANAYFGLRLQLTLIVMALHLLMLSAI